MNVREFYSELEKLYPASLSCEWDNDGIMCSSEPKAEVKNVLVSLDATEPALKYAAENGFDLVLTHHPMIFRGVKSVTSDGSYGTRIISSLANGISVISLHTRLDAGEGGVNDCLTGLLGLNNIRSFGDSENPFLGRIGLTDHSDPENFAKVIKAALKTQSVNAYIHGPVKRVAVIAGKGEDYIGAAVMAGADTFVTGECGYNDALDACEAGLNVFEAGHFFTEFPVCTRLAELAASIAGAKVEIFTGFCPKQI